MKGKTNKQILEERAEVVKELKEKGCEVVNTIFSVEPPKDCDTALFYLSKSIKAMSKSDLIFFMHGWEKSRGCKIEHDIALAYGKPIREGGDGR